jgi:pimeloyl-ACP methyl ester carboxylesterase
MRPLAGAGIGALLASLLLVGCATPRDRLARSAAEVESALAALSGEDAGAWPKAERRYRRAIERALPQLGKAGAGDSVHLIPGGSRALVESGFERVVVARGGPKRFPALHREGHGLAAVGVRRGPAPPFPAGGLFLPVTLVAEPLPAGKGPPGAVGVRLLDSLRVDHVRIGERNWPLAMNLEAALEKLSASGPGPLDGLLHAMSGDRLAEPRLTILEPFDPEKIPVVFIHGLMSSPLMWKRVVMELAGDPAIRDRCQFWVFYYASGQPVPLSALQLGEALDRMAAMGPLKPAILVGHSMGGILARRQVSRSGLDAAGAILPGVSLLPEGNLVRRSLVFEPRSDVGRVIFISTPHGGSGIAVGGIGRLGKMLFRLPGHVVEEVGSLVPRDPRGRLPTSVHGLAPGSPFLALLGRQRAGIPAHSIIGQRRPGPPEAGSDGVVDYSSSHIPWAQSEKIVSSGHGAHSHPEAIAELRRILLEH